MQIKFNTTLDQDVGLEAIHAESGSQKPLDKFAEDLCIEFLNNLKPRLQNRRRTRVARLLDEAVDAKIAEVEAILKP